MPYAVPWVYRLPRLSEKQGIYAGFILLLSMDNGELSEPSEEEKVS